MNEQRKNVMSFPFALLMTSLMVILDILNNASLVIVERVTKLVGDLGKNLTFHQV